MVLKNCEQEEQRNGKYSNFLANKVALLFAMQLIRDRTR